MAGTNFFTTRINADGNSEDVAFTDKAGNPILVSGTTVPTLGTYAKGCLFIKSDAADGTKAVYENQGTTSTASFNLVGDVTAGEITLNDANILVGNASNVAAGVSMSGDATISNTGVITVTKSTGDFTTNGKFIGASITATSGADAVAVTGTLHEVTTTGTGDALTLVNGTAGQKLTVVYVAEGAGGDTAVLTPTTLAGGSTITFNALGDSADLTYSSTGGWYMTGGTASIA